MKKDFPISPEDQKVRERGGKDPIPYTADGWRASRPFRVEHGPVTGTGAAPLGWIEHSVYSPRWYTDDEYAERLEAETRVIRARQRIEVTS